MDVVAVAQAAELLLAGGVPAVKQQLAAAGLEVQRVHLHADGGCAGKELRRRQREREKRGRMSAK